VFEFHSALVLFYYLQHFVILALKVDAPLKHSLVRPNTVLMVLARDKWRSKVQAHINAGASSLNKGFPACTLGSTVCLNCARRV